MTPKDIIEIKNNDKTILLNSGSFSLIKYKSNVLQISWHHPSRKLTIIKVNDPTVIKQFKVLVAENYKYLLLNPNKKGHEKIFEILIGDENNKIELLKTFPPDSFRPPIIIVDKQ